MREGRGLEDVFPNADDVCGCTVVHSGEIRKTEAIRGSPS